MDCPTFVFKQRKIALAALAVVTVNLAAAAAEPY